MQNGKLLGWGIAIYAIMYLTASAISLYQVSPPILARILTLLTLVVIALLAGRSLRRTSMHDILGYSLFWMIEIALLDALMSVPYAGWRLYLDWNVWLGYGLVVIVPLFSIYLNRRVAPPREI